MEVAFLQVDTLWVKLQGGIKGSLFFQEATDHWDLGPGSFPSDAIKILWSPVQTSEPRVSTHAVHFSGELKHVFGLYLQEQKALVLSHESFCYADYHIKVREPLY